MFFLIAGTGHCGTQWLASFLNRPDDGIVCTHEEKWRIEPYTFPWDGWRLSLEHERAHGIDEWADGYIALMNQRQQEVAIVGDAHSWEPFMIPQLATRLRIDRIIYLVRNGVQNVHSLYYHNKHIYQSESWWYEDYLQSFADLIGLDGLDDFGLGCAWWGANVATAKKLEAVAPVQVVRLEDLTSDPAALIDLTKGLQHLARPTEEECRQHAGVDLNRKIKGRRDPDYLWSQWTAEQRATFERVCGDAMHHYGYEIPQSPRASKSTPRRRSVAIDQGARAPG